MTAPYEGHDTRSIPLPKPVKQKLKDLLVAISLANLLFIRPSFDLLFDSDRFFDKLIVTRWELFALLTNIFGAALLVWIGMRLTHRFRNPVVQVFLHVLFLLLLVIPADFIRTKFYGIADYRVVTFFRQPIVMLAVIVLVPLILWQHRRVAITVAGALGILSSFAIVILFKIGLLCLDPSHLKQCVNDTPPPPLKAVRADGPRVVWIIFDELDYRVVFEQRPPGVQLPEFDRIEKETLHADKAYSPGDATLFSMPALILGRRLVSDAPYGCDLMVTPYDTGETVGFYGQPTVFSEAQKSGFNTALVGWYIPYDRILNGQLNFCAWYPWPPFESARSATYLGALHNQFASLAWSFHVRQVYAQLCENGLQEAISVATNNAYGLTLLHLPPPHRPGVYSAAKHSFSIWDTIFHMSGSQGYFNNLALADHELGALRQAMENTGEWTNTWVIISADHSWRSSTMYDNHRDLRVPYLVKPPGQTDSSFYSSRFNTVLTHDLILSILRQHVTNRDAVVDWLDAHREGHDFIPQSSTAE